MPFLSFSFSAYPWLKVKRIFNFTSRNFRLMSQHSLTHSTTLSRFIFVSFTYGLVQVCFPYISAKKLRHCLLKPKAIPVRIKSSVHVALHLVAAVSEYVSMSIFIHERDERKKKAINNNNNIE